MNDLPDAVRELDSRITAYIEQGIDNPDTETFDELALAVFRLQYDGIPLYRRYCRKRGIAPDGIDSWQQIPAVPTDAFKAAEFCLLPAHTSRTFLTSGTSAGDEKGTVGYDPGGLCLMDATIRVAGRTFLFPDENRPTMLILAPDPVMAPQMIMVYGMNHLIENFGSPDSRFMIGPEGFRPEQLVAVLKEATAQNRPVAVCGGSFGFVNFFDYCEKQGHLFELPAGSRCLDAGGFKGRSREVGRNEFIQMCARYLEIPENYSVNLLGMTETASQFYDDSLRNSVGAITGRRKKISPPWTRTLVVDPETLAPLPSGEIGLLKHCDLGNRGHIFALQTDDLGVAVDGGFEVIGPAGHGEARGCSLTIDELTEAMSA